MEAFIQPVVEVDNGAVAALRLGTEIGSDVTEVIPRAHQQNHRLHNKEFVQSLCTDGTLTGVLRIPDAIADIAADQLREM